ncbi:MAG: cation-translocating P-type ATPase [Candidatus Altiarchaeota archaeon]|nr:cation-translocating P-type ATPase [Candidatus Altiarchaeota archaeon]
MDILWHAKSGGDVLCELGSKDKGLSGKDAKDRLVRDGLNEIVGKKPITALQIFLEQFKDFLIILLLAAAAVSMGVGIYEGSIQEMIEAGLIIVIVIFIAVVGFYQRYSAEKELDALKKMMTPHARVLRDGVEKNIDAKELVVGDIVLLDAGDRVPADLRILESYQLKADESSLTGESTPVEKTTEKLNEKTSLADRKNMLYMGTTVVYGRAKAVVVEIGMRTQLGEIAENITEMKEEKTPLQERLNVLGKQIGIGVLFLCAFIMVVEMVVNHSHFLEVFMIAIALAVAAVPEGLPGVVTIALASGMRKMVSENVIVRKLPAVETLGSTTVICTDKTGTLTKNEMTLKNVWTLDSTYDLVGDGYGFSGGFKDEKGRDISKLPKDLVEVLEASALVCDATADGKGGITGDPTEAALVVAAYKGNVDQVKLKDRYKKVDEVPFSSERKRKTIVYRMGKDSVALSLGAPDVLVKSCSKVMKNGKVEKLSKKDLERILNANSDYASRAFRVLGLAKKKAGSDLGRLESDMVFVGLVAMIDPPRQESKKAVAECKSAGIRVIMITGDHMLTAKAIAEDLGIHSEGHKVLSGQELEEMSDEELEKTVDDVSVYARVSPIHKLRIVSALQKRGNVVAMTGDGVNDAPALKKADIGVAMGITGTEVSKEAADMVLTDDNFASIVKAVEEGRGIYDNIRKFFAYLISGNIGEVAIVFFSSIIPGAPIALTASQILVVNLVTDGFPALALGVDPFEPGAMRRKPRPRNEPLHRGLAPFIVWYPVLMIIVAMGLFLWIWDPVKQNVYEVQTVAFLTLAFFEMYQAFASRSTRYPATKVGLFKNKYLLLAVGASLAVILALVYIPITIPGSDITLQELTHTVPLSPGLFLTIFLLSSIGFIYLEIAKWWSTRKEAY